MLPPGDRNWYLIYPYCYFLLFIHLLVYQRGESSSTVRGPNQDTNVSAAYDFLSDFNPTLLNFLAVHARAMLGPC
jgi:hypothetical protein